MATPTITAQLTPIWTAEGITNWSGEVVSLDPDLFVEGSNSLGMTKVSEEICLSKYDYYTANSSVYLNFSSTTTIYMWVLIPKSTGLAAKSAGGIGIYVEDSTAANGYWNVGGYDNYFGGWTCFCVSTNQTLSSGSISDWTQIRYVGIRVNMLGKTTANAKNVWFDVCRHGTGITAYGGTSGDKINFEGIYAATTTTSTAYGIIRKSGGAYLLQGKLTLGDSGGTNACYFADTDKVVIFEDVSVTTGLFEIKVVGNTTGITNVQLGTLTTIGSTNLTSAGCVIRRQGTTNMWGFVVTDNKANITVLLYGCLFSGCTTNQFGTAAIAMSSTLIKIIGCTFSSCGSVLYNLTNASDILENNTFASSSATAAVQIYAVPATGMIAPAIISNTRGVEIMAAVTVLIKRVIFANNTTDAYFSTTATATLNAVDCTDNFTIGQSVNWNCYEKTTYNLNLKNEGGGAIPTAGVRLVNAQTTQIFSVETNASGDIAEQQVSRRSRVYSGSLTTTIHNPFEMKFRRYGYVQQKFSKTYGATTVTDAFVMIDDNMIVNTPREISLQFVSGTKTIERTTGSFITDGWDNTMKLLVRNSTSNNGSYTITDVQALVITVSEALVNEGPATGATLIQDVSAFTGITINEGTSPMRIELSSVNHSLYEMYAFLKYYASQTANMDLLWTLSTADKITYIVTNYDFQVDTVQLTGADSILYMPEKDFTVINSGSQGLKKLTDIDGTQVSIQLTNVIPGSRCYIKDENDVELMNTVTSSSIVSVPYVHTVDKELYIRVRRSGRMQIATLASGGYTNCVPTDIGKDVTDDTVTIGKLITYNNTTRIWYVETYSMVINGSALDIPTGTGEGTANADSITGKRYISYTGGGTVTSDGFSGFVSQVEDTNVY